MPTGPGPHSPHLRARPPGEHRGTCGSPDGTPAPGSSPIAISFGESRRAGCTRSRTPPRPGAARVPGRPRSTANFGSHRERSGTLNTREVGRGWDSSSADARQGPPDMVRTPTAAAVRPLPGIRRQAPGRGLAPGGRRRACLGRVSMMSTIKARADSMPARATCDVEGPSRDGQDSSHS